MGRVLLLAACVALCAACADQQGTSPRSAPAERELTWWTASGEDPWGFTWMVDSWGHARDAGVEVSWHRPGPTRLELNVRRPTGLSGFELQLRVEGLGSDAPHGEADVRWVSDVGPRSGWLEDVGGVVVVLPPGREERSDEPGAIQFHLQGDAPWGQVELHGEVHPPDASAKAEEIEETRR